MITFNRKSFDRLRGCRLPDFMDGERLDYKPKPATDKLIREVHRLYLRQKKDRSAEWYYKELIKLGRPGLFNGSAMDEIEEALGICKNGEYLF